MSLFKRSNSTPSNRPLLIINADTTQQQLRRPDRKQERLTDYTALADALQADIIDWKAINSNPATRLLAKVAGKGIALALMAFMRRGKYPLFYSDAENNGLVLAILFKLSRTKKPLLMIGHWITPPKKIFLIKLLRLNKQITTLFLHSSAQYQQVVGQLGLDVHQVRLIPYQVDTEFWKVENATIKPVETPYILTAGLEFRDYPTLIEAVKNLPLELKIGAASNWSKRKDSTLQVDLPPNVKVSSYSYTQLRDMYANCRFVVVPLFDTDFQAGITVILEAMAMGKAVIVTRSRGQFDTIVDRRKSLRTKGVNTAFDTIGRFTWFLDEDNSEDLTHPTGFYVSPGNVEELKRGIEYLLTHPEDADKIGRNGRRVVENLMSVEKFAERIKQAVDEHLNPDQAVEDLDNSALNQKIEAKVGE